jgi:hypothetical protein
MSSVDFSVQPLCQEAGPLDEVDAYQRAIDWATNIDGTLVTRDGGFSEERMALDVLAALAEIQRLRGLLGKALKFIDDLNCDGCEYEDDCPSNARHYICRPCQAAREAARIRAAGGSER